MEKSRKYLPNCQKRADIDFALIVLNKGNNKITELRTILHRESQNSLQHHLNIKYTSLR